MTVSTKISVFKNEPFTDFSLEENKQAMQAALMKVKKNWDKHILSRLERIKSQQKK